MKTTLFEGRVAINRVAISVEEPERILVVPWGEVDSEAGGFIVDGESASAVIAAFARHGTDLPIDLEHQTLGGEYASPTGAAPAVGWIKSLEAVPSEGIYANVEWTAAGCEYVKAKQYRYLSPVTIVRKRDRRMVGLHSVALTNTPAIVGMVPIVNKHEVVVNMNEKFDRAMWFLNLEATATEDEIMSALETFLAQLRELVGVAESADQGAIVSALKAKLERPAEGGLKAAVCKALALDPEKTASDDEVVAAVNALRKPPADVVPRAEFDAVANSLKEAREMLTALEAKSTDHEAEARIANALGQGKLTESMLEADAAGKNHFRELARQQADWEAFIARQPVVAPASGSVVANSGRSRAAAGGGRVAVINKAKGEWDGERELQALCSKEAYVADQLREAELEPALSDKDKELLVAN
ncbi:MAG: phage protease [Planctomycetota bacterium]